MSLNFRLYKSWPSKVLNRNVQSNGPWSTFSHKRVGETTFTLRDIQLFPCLFCLFWAFAVEGSGTHPDELIFARWIAWKVGPEFYSQPTISNSTLPSDPKLSLIGPSNPQHLVYHNWGILIFLFNVHCMYIFDLSIPFRFSLTDSILTNWNHSLRPLPC